MLIAEGSLAAVEEILARHKGVRLGLIPTTAEAAKAIAAFGKTTGSYVSVQAPTGRFLEAMVHGETFPEPARSAFEPDARAKVLALGLKQRHQDLRSAGGAFDLDEVRELMHGVTSQAVGKRVREGSLLAVPGPSNRRRYPTAQFMNDGTVVRGLKDVNKAFPSASPWMLLNFLVNPDTRLGESTPMDLLKRGEVDLVVEAARRVGQQGA